jgi:signal transduction histidine kinase
VNLAELAAQLVTEASARYPHLDIRVEAAELASIRGDAQRLLLVGNRLLENACQAARSQVRMHLAAAPTRNAIEWTVTDDGPALSEDLLERLFDTFTTSRRGTLGLGLGPVRKVVLLHGGHVEAENRPEGGLSVRVMLPREPPQAGD